MVLIVLAAFLLSRFIERSLTEMLVESRALQSERLRADAHNALETTLAVLADYQAEDNGLHAPVQGWGDPLAGAGFTPRAGTTVEVTVEDESAKLPLPRLEAPALEALGAWLGLKEADASRFADALLTWTHRDHTSARFETDPRSYERENPPHRAPGRPLESFDELAAVAVARDFFYTPDGKPTELRAQLARSVSLQDFPSTNLNTASPETLVLAGLDATQAGKLADFNAGKIKPAAGAPPYFRSPAEAQAIVGATAPLAGFDTTAWCLRIRVTVHEGATAFRLEAVVSPVSAITRPPEAAPAAGASVAGVQPATAVDLNYPFTLLALEENIELPAPPS
ncbi:MAG: type secretory pathway, component PulK [Lacunisphaera sp.]|nr:type secretory pathway, component PulK [Lacunisphaera sp.]